MTSKHSRAFLVLGVAIALCAGVPSLFAEELRLSARDLFEESVAKNLQLSEDGKSLELERGELFEDDGPAAGFSYKPNEEKLARGIWIKKELLVPNPRATKATLLVGRGGELRALLNGQAVELKSEGKAGNYWDTWSFSPEVLKQGKNEIVLYGAGSVWIARGDEFPAGAPHPGRSARSTDEGKTWAQDRLGPEGNLAGEYYVRLFLDHHRPQGSLLSPVLDAGNMSKRAIAPSLAKLGPVRVAIEGESGSGGTIKARVRFGSEPIPGSKTWSAWQDLPASGGSIAEPSGRYLQLAIELSTSDPLTTPRLTRVSIQAEPKQAEGGAGKLKLLEAHNPQVVRSSIPFRYEPFDQPRLRELRQQQKLDDVVRGAASELELIGRLAAWSSRQWDQGHLKDIYPNWDALEILKPHADGKPVGGFCQQYNLVFLQACESFGLVGRPVSLGPGSQAAKIRGGHEVVEIWSNEHRKWIYVDGNTAWYARDAGSKLPLSLWELRTRQLATLRGEAPPAIEIVRLAESKHEWKGLDAWPPFVELRMVPRSNVLEQKEPLPLNQGMRGWFWPGHHVWSDSLAPAALLYGNRVRRRGDWDWTINHAHLVLEGTDRDGELRVHLDTETPGFDTFLARINAGEKRPVASGFLWKLEPGRNRLEVVPRNKAGREGSVSWVVVEAP